MYPAARRRYICPSTEMIRRFYRGLAQHDDRSPSAKRRAPKRQRPVGEKSTTMNGSCTHSLPTGRHASAHRREAKMSEREIFPRPRPSNAAENHLPTGRAFLFPILERTAKITISHFPLCGPTRQTPPSMKLPNPFTVRPLSAWFAAAPASECHRRVQSTCRFRSTRRPSL